MNQMDSGTIIGTPDKGLMTEYMVSPKFGKPNSTYYAFKVYDISGTLQLSVKLYERATGTTTYKPMTRSGNYWVLSTRIAINGWYDWRYVYSISKQPISTAASYTLCNTRNVFSSTSSITWPFGADGSSWSNRTINSQKWYGGEETKGTSSHVGYGWNEGTHTGTDERYSDDWNRGTGIQDRYAEIRSPLDGYVSEIGSYSTSSGSQISYFVAIVQEFGGIKYRFYVSHLEEKPSYLSVGQYVRAGYTKIGRLGMSGATSPHAHVSLRNATNGSRISLPFYFNAQ